MKQGIGRMNGFKNPDVDKKVIALFTKNPNILGRKITEKRHCSEMFVRKVKKKEGLKFSKVQKVPDRDFKNRSTAKDQAKQLSGVDFYVADHRRNVQEEFKTQKNRQSFQRNFWFGKQFVAVVKEAALLLQLILSTLIYTFRGALAIHKTT